MGLPAMEKYKEFVRAISLEDISLVDLQLKRPVEVRPGPWEFSITPKFELVELSSSKLKTSARFAIDARVEADQAELLTIEGQFYVTYKIEEAVEVDNDIITQFIETNVPINSWPYIRELITSLTSRAGLPALVIGTLKVIR